jgi:hypothetical protein
MIIYTFDTCRYKCGNSMDVFTYVWFQNSYADVLLAYKDWMIHEVYAKIEIEGKHKHFDKN